MSEKYSAVYSPEALDDIRKSYSYIAFEFRVPSMALNQVNYICKEICSLDLMPMRYLRISWNTVKDFCHYNPI